MEVYVSFHFSFFERRDYNCFIYVYSPLSKIVITAVSHVFFRDWRGTQWCSWLRHCATIRKVSGSIPDGVFKIFHGLNPSSHTMTLGLSLLLTEISTRNNCLG